MARAAIGKDSDARGVIESMALREDQAMYVASQLVPRAALLTRLLARQLRGELSRPEIGVLNTLQSGPRRITDLAELEGVAQPTMTQLVKRLERQGLVARAGQPGDAD